MINKRILFIINPISGTKKKKTIPTLIRKYLDENIEFEVDYTRSVGDGSTICEKNINRFDIIVAVGGDGTINEIAKPLINSETSLGIIPMGSGNGLARHLGIPLRIKKAIKILNNPKIIKIDTIRVLNSSFINVAGVGFDALISYKFAQSKKRGVFSYAKLIFSELNEFKPNKNVVLDIDGKSHFEKNPFLISIANSSQYGNNVIIAPKAKVTDGLMNVCILQKVPTWYYPILAFRLFAGTIHRSHFYKDIQCKKVSLKTIDGIKEDFLNIDGESQIFNSEIVFSINPLSLKIAV